MSASLRDHDAGRCRASCQAGGATRHTPLIKRKFDQAGKAREGSSLELVFTEINSWLYRAIERMSSLLVRLLLDCGESTFNAFTRTRQLAFAYPGQGFTALPQGQ